MKMSLISKKKQQNLPSKVSFSFILMDAYPRSNIHLTTNPSMKNETLLELFNFYCTLNYILSK